MQCGFVTSQRVSVRIGGQMTSSTRETRSKKRFSDVQECRMEANLRLCVTPSPVTVRPTSIPVDIPVALHHIAAA